MFKKFDNAKNLLRFGFLTACSISTSQWPDKHADKQTRVLTTAFNYIFYGKIVCMLKEVFDEWMIFAT
jgi:hypothetical protein